VLTATGASSSAALAQTNLTFDGTTLAVTGNVTTTSTTSNSIGGITLSNNRIGVLRPAPVVAVEVAGDISGAGILGTYFRNAIIPTTFDISGGNFSNSATIRTGSGTVGAPSYTFGADASLGFYRPTANQLAFASAGRERLRIDAAGLVGIGTTAPEYPLDISFNNVTNQAAVRIPSWVRQSTSNFFWVRGIAALTGSNNAGLFNTRIRWSNANSNFFSLDLIEWTQTTSNGSSFRVLKSGIWSIHYTAPCTTSAGFSSWIDISTSPMHGYPNPLTNGVGQVIAASCNANPGVITVAFTGYLGVGANNHIRMSVNGALNTRANVQPYLNIALLYETPDITPTFP
jgi:hypothetical protein